MEENLGLRRLNSQFISAEIHGTPRDGMSDSNKIEPAANRQSSQYWPPPTNAKLIDKPVRRNGSSQLWAALQCGWPGVILMGGVYGVVAPICLGFISLIFGTGSVWLVVWPLAAVASLTLGATFGLLSWAVCSVIAVLAIVLVNSTLGMVFGHRASVAIFGGLTGFLATFWMVLASDDPKARVLGFCFVAMAIVLGHVGALAWAGRSGIWQMIRANAGPGEERIQFHIWHLLVATIWCSGLLALDRLCPNHELIVLLVGYVVIQYCCFRLDQALVKRRLAKAKRKRIGVA